MALSNRSLVGRLSKIIRTTPNLFPISAAPAVVLANIGPLPASLGEPAFIAYEDQSRWLAIGTCGVAGRNAGVDVVVPFDSIASCGPVNPGPKHEFTSQFETFRFELLTGGHVDSWFPKDNAGFFSLWSAIKMMVGSD